ncbi:MAG: PKD domain-containing protein, partial [Bacteroidetes bacterium]|nr:PKD domain-containing protein [Bacteroidota bacterium]
MIRSFTTLVLLLGATSIFAQKPVFQGNYQATEPFTELSDQFNASEVFQIDVQALNEFVTNAGDNSEFTLGIGEHQWDISLEKRDLRSPSYISTVLTDKGEKTLPNGETMTYRGQHPGADGWSVALTMDNEFLYGYIKEGYSTYYIEPLWYFVPGQPKDLFVVYAAADVKPNPDKKCGLETMVEKMEELLPEDMKGDIHDDGAEKMMACKEIELAIAADLSMYNAFGSVPAVNAFTFGVMNNVQTNYDDEFNDELHFEIVEQFVVAPPASDPWTNSNDAGTLLSSFTNWGPSGFSATHDIGQLWTDRNLSGGTVGIAWLCAVCNSNRYHVVSNFTTNSTFLRVMTAHEIGHNFCAQHDAPNSGFIMQPSVGTSNSWSQASQDAINGFYPGRWCLGTCASSQPPTANFIGTPTTGCTPLSVAFTDQSTNGPISWNWTFPGGNPGTSTMQNPTVVYNTAGVFNVTLTATNLAGSNTVTKTNYISVQSQPAPGFTWAQVGLTLIFTNTSSPNSTSFLWNFGDGGTSTATNPTHTYAIDGFYDVTLTATNICGSIPMMITIPVY